jgi:acyl carrier protein
MSTTITPEAVEKVVFSALESFGVEPELLTIDASFTALDIDSLDLAEMAQVLDDEFGVELRGDDVKGIESVRDLVDRVVAKAG